MSEAEEKFCPFDQFATSCSEGCGLYNKAKDMCGLAMLSESKELIATLIEALGMFSENMQRQHQGYSMAYNDVAFYKLLPKE